MERDQKGKKKKNLCLKKDKSTGRAARNKTVNDYKDNVGS